VKSLNYSPIGVFRCTNQYKYEAPRQPYEDESDELGYVRLFSGMTNFSQALNGLEGFERLWLIFEFNQSEGWKPMTRTPRSTKKQGVFATRSPYRPNPIGMSCVRFEKIEGLKIFVKEFDLLDRTPILDIKPYIPQVDSFKVSNRSWLEEEDLKEVSFSDEALNQIKWIEEKEEGKIKSFIIDQLKRDPLNNSKKRVRQIEGDLHCLAFRTWRVYFLYSYDSQSSKILFIKTGYSEEDFNQSVDKYQNKELHREFMLSFHD
jgi:tRNA-Thr(GGU) m(6)t(6)A37 methyltransferase TsaA